MSEWTDRAEAFAFVGNSLLSPMSQTGSVAAGPLFWSKFPNFDNEGVRGALGQCEAWAAGVQALANPVQEASKEFARLFVGPPSPAAAPWETFYRENAKRVGFGVATFEMRALLRSEGLELSNENHQYEDHVGIELLYLSTLCAKAEADNAYGERARAFCQERLLEWLPDLHGAVRAEASGGFIDAILALALAICHDVAAR